jgi:hypothetical protein
MKAVKLVHFGIILLWFFLLSFLFYKDHSGATLERNKLLQEAFQKKTYWYDIYSKTKKIGFAKTSFEQAGDEILIKQERAVHVIRKQSGEKTILFKKLRCLTDLYYMIKSFEYISHLKGKQGIKVNGKVEQDNISLFLDTSRKRKAYNLPVKDMNFYIPLTFMPVVHQKVPVSDMRLSIPILNFSSLTIDDVNVVLEEIRPVKISHDVQNIYKFRMGDLLMWTNERGIIVKEQLGGTVLYLQQQKIAENSEERVLFDITSLPYFKSNKMISDTEILNRLSVRIKNFRLIPRLYENSFVTLNDNILRINNKGIERLKKKSYTLPSEGDSSLHKYLNPDDWVSSEYRPIKNTGEIYARSFKHDAFSFAQYLYGYVYNIIKTWPVFVLSDGEDILKTLSGDYLERTVLFASYARAGGLPTRLVGGLVYVDGYFYFHTWPEVWLKMWVPLDPTLFQFPADVTHIPLKEGTLEDIVSITDDLKDIEIEVLEAS